jgi:hypothetical protein
MENNPSCASPVKPENSIALNPQMEVSTPSRIVGQIRSSAWCGAMPGAVCVNR